MELLAEFKKILYIVFRATLNFQTLEACSLMIGQTVVMMTHPNLSLESAGNCSEPP